MQVFLDTSVLVAASVADHPHHGRARPVLQRVASGDDIGYVGAHSIAETYAALTRVPVIPRVHPSEAARIVRDNIMRSCNVVPPDTDLYLEALTLVQDRGMPGARIYDALLLACAARSGAERIYTFNLGDFRDLAPPGLQPRIAAP
jgi:predicted nucleic acid-binding protein